MADDADQSKGNGEASPRVSREASADYLMEMTLQLADLARRYDEAPMAILLEAIIAARRAQAETRPV